MEITRVTRKGPTKDLTLKRYSRFNTYESGSKVKNKRRLAGFILWFLAAQGSS